MMQFTDEFCIVTKVDKDHAIPIVTSYNKTLWEFCYPFVGYNKQLWKVTEGK